MPCKTLLHLVIPEVNAYLRLPCNAFVYPVLTDVSYTLGYTCAELAGKLGHVREVGVGIAVDLLGVAEVGCSPLGRNSQVGGQLLVELLQRAVAVARLPQLPGRGRAEQQRIPPCRIA